VLYALMFLAVLVPSLIPIGMPIKITSEVRNVHNRIEAVKPGEIILVDFGYDPSTAAELEPMAKAMLRHAFSRNLRVLTNGSQDESPSFAPNGAMVIYATRERGRGSLATASSDGRFQQRLSSDQGDVREPAWSPFPVR
jgi:hypothetical protein